MCLRFESQIQYFEASLVYRLTNRPRRLVDLDEITFTIHSAAANMELLKGVWI